MSAEKALYLRWINELWAGKPIAADIVSGDFVGHWPHRDLHGPEQLQAIVDETHTMLSELEFTIEIEPFVSGDLVAARWIGTGATDTGPVRFTGNDILRVADGRFVEYWVGTSTPS